MLSVRREMKKSDQGEYREMQMHHRRWRVDEPSRTCRRSQRDSLHEIDQSVLPLGSDQQALPNKAVASPVFNAVDNVYFC